MKLKGKITFLALLLVLAWPLTAGAQAVNESKPGSISAADQKVMEKVETLRDSLWAKRAELKALQQAGNVEGTKAVAAEMNKLKAQIREERGKLSADFKNFRKKDGKRLGGKGEGKKDRHRGDRPMVGNEAS